MGLGHEHGFILMGLAGPMDVVNLSLSLSSWPSQMTSASHFRQSAFCIKFQFGMHTTVGLTQQSGTLLRAWDKRMSPHYGAEYLIRYTSDIQVH